MITIVLLFAVVDRNGLVRRRRNGTVMVYDNQKQATRQAKNDGDSVVTVAVDLSVKPLFIRNGVLDE